MNKKQQTRLNSKIRRFLRNPEIKEQREDGGIGKTIKGRTPPRGYAPGMTGSVPK